MNSHPRWELEPGVVYRWTLGTLSIWISRVESEWLYAWNHRDDTPPSIELCFTAHDNKPDDLAWTRIIAPDAEHTVSFAPRLADRAVVIKGQESIAVLPRSNALLYAPVPVWIAVYSGATESRLLFDAPTRRLHRRWFGNSMQGSLCYSVFARLESDRALVDLEPVSAICPIRIRNQGSEPFRTDSVFIQANEFKLYRLRDNEAGPFGRLVTSTEVINVAGVDELSFAVAQDRGKAGTDMELVADWRKRPDDSWWKRGYVLFQRISNY